MYAMLKRVGASTCMECTNSFAHLLLFNAASQCVQAIFEYVISTQQLNPPWLSLLIVTHLRTVNFKKFPGGVNSQLFKMILNRCQVCGRGFR